MKDYRIVLVYAHHALESVAIKHAGKLAAQFPPGTKRLPRVEVFNGEGWIDLETGQPMSLQAYSGRKPVRRGKAKAVRGTKARDMRA